MKAELVRQESELAQRQEAPRSIIEAVMRAAADPNIDVNKMAMLVEMQFKIEARQAEVEFHAALARLMPKLPRIEKNGVIPDANGNARSYFARYEDIDRAIRPLLAEEGFSISFRTEEPAPGNLRVTGTLAHRMGHARESSVTVPISAPPKATGTQAVGSSVSYGKRYVVMNMLNIVTVGEDNDGQGDPAPIGAEQVMALETLLQDSKADRKKFLAWAGVAKLEDILEKDYPARLSALQSALRAFQAKEKR